MDGIPPIVSDAPLSRRVLAGLQSYSCTRADFLDLATSPPRDLIPGPPVPTTRSSSSGSMKETPSRVPATETTLASVGTTKARSKTTAVSKPLSLKNPFQLDEEDRKPSTVTLTQFEVLATREGKNLKRDWSLFVRLRRSPCVVQSSTKSDLTGGGFKRSSCTISWQLSSESSSGECTSRWI